MSVQGKRDFDKEAAQWDAQSRRVKLANDVARAIIREINPSVTMDVIDFGCGTGLLTLNLQPFVKSITGLDSSQEMLGMLEKKVAAQGLSNVQTQFVDIENKRGIDGSYDLIVSNMTLHHVPDTAALFKEWFRILRPKGQLCFADLDAEDGSFHPDNTGVFHFGFDREKLRQLLQDAGFSDVRDTTASTITKENDKSGAREYPVFLISTTRIG